MAYSFTNNGADPLGLNKSTNKNTNPVSGFFGNLSTGINQMMTQAQPGGLSQATNTAKPVVSTAPVNIPAQQTGLMSTVPKNLQSSVSSTPTIQKTSNVTATGYDYGGQHFEMNPTTGRFEVSTKTTGNVGAAGGMGSAGNIATATGTTGTNAGMLGTPSNPYTPSPSFFGSAVTGLANRAAQPIDQYQQIQDRLAENARQQNQLMQDVLARKQQIGTSGIDLTLATGEKGLLAERNQAALTGLQQEAAALSNMLGAANTQQQLQQQALQQAAGLAQPIMTTPTQTPYNPITGEFVGGGSQIERAIKGANIGSAQDLTQQKNQIQSVFNGAEANFRLLLNTAKKGGVNDLSVPAINAINQAIQRGVASNEDVINFQNTLATVRSQYAQILGGGTATVDSNQRAAQAIPSDISLGALQSLEQQLKAEATNRINGIDQQIKNITGTTTGSTTGGKTGGTTGKPVSGFGWNP